MAVFTETIQLVDQVSAPAKQAGTALASAGKAMGSLSKSTFDAANAMKVGKESIGAAITGIKSAFTSLAGGDVKGAIQGVTDSIAGMSKLLDLAVPGLGQAVAAIVQIAGGLVGVTAGLAVSMAKFAIEASEAKQASLATWDALGEGLIKGTEVDDMLDELKSKLGASKDQLGVFATAFLKMGINGKEALEGLTESAMFAEAITTGAGDGFVKLFQKVDAAAQTSSGKIVLPAKGLQKALVAAGLNIGDMSKEMGLSTEAFSAQMSKGGIDAKKFGLAMQDAIAKKGAGAMERLANSSANLKKIFQENIGDMFEDLSDIVQPFMKEIKSLFDIFGKDAPTAKAATSTIRVVLTQMFAVATKLVPIIKLFLIDMIIFGLQAKIKIKQLTEEFDAFQQAKEFLEPIAAVVLPALWTVLKAVGVVLLVVVAVMLALWAAMIVVSVAVWTAVGAFLGFVSEAGGALAGWIASAATAAYDFVAGLVSGIANGAGAVIGAVSGLADSATGAFKSALGISSPSKVMMGLGGHTSAGFAEGIEGGAGDVHGAASGVAGAAVKGASSGGDASSGGAKGGGGNTINVSVTIDGAGKSAEGITQELVSAVFEQMAMQGAA